MACTKDGIYHDIEESVIKNKYFIGNDELIIYFSSEFNQKRFNDKIDNYVHDETAKFNNKLIAHVTKDSSSFKCRVCGFETNQYKDDCPKCSAYDSIYPK